MQIVPNKAGARLLISDEDADRVLSHKWLVFRDKDYWRCTSAKMTKGVRKTLILSRFIMDAKPGVVVDHISGDTLDNRRENLRICTVQENMQNRAKHRGGRARFKGVKFDARYKCPWVMSIRVEGHRIALRFKTEVEAALAYDEAARLHHGAFASVNFPRDGERGALSAVAEVSFHAHTTSSRSETYLVPRR